MKKLVILDLDGTLADTSEGIYNSIRYAQKKMNLKPISEAQMKTHIGPPMEESYIRSFSLSGEDLKRAIAFHKEYARERGFREIRFYRGMEELLMLLKARGISCAVATLKAQDTAEQILQDFTKKGLIQLTAGVPQNHKIKKAEMIALCRKRFCAAPQESVLVGDSGYDAVAANEAGVDFFAVTYGFGFSSKEEALSSGAKQVFSNVSEIYEYFSKEGSENV